MTREQARAIIEIQAFFDILKLKYPEIYEDMSSWKDNNNCTCGTRFLNFLNLKYKDNQEKIFLDSILKNEEVIEKIKQIEQQNAEAAEAYKKRLFHGKVIKMDRSPQSWEELSEMLEKNGAIFKSFSILEDGENIEVRFL